VTDVRLFQTENGGEIDIVNGQVLLNDGLETAAYLSLFGGNEDDAGIDATAELQWWGNAWEADPANQVRSETQFLLKNIPATTGNLRRIEDAANRDLQWLLDRKLANSITVAASIPKIDVLTLTIVIVIDDREYKYVFTAAWRARTQ
jgi:phage gp46-like protein